MESSLSYQQSAISSQLSAVSYQVSKVISVATVSAVLKADS
jgi:hypothetical protein